MSTNHPGTDLPARPTLKTISEMTGFSVATVSRALKDAPDIGEDTKKRVRDTARAVGYRPNRAGVRLRTGRTQVIALALPTESHVMNHTAQLIYSISDALRDTPYHLIVAPYASTDDPMETVRYIVETQSADGIIINQVLPQDPRVRFMAAHDFPFATHGRTELGLEHCYFDYDNAQFGEMAVDELAARGRKRIVFLAPPADQSYGVHMRDGAKRSAARHGVALEIFEDIDSDSAMHLVGAAFLDRFSAGSPPDGVIVGAASAALAAVASIDRVGMSPGVDYDLVAKEAVEFLSLVNRNLIIFNENVSNAGAFLAHGLIGVIEGKGPIRQGLDKPVLVGGRDPAGD